MKNMLNKNKKCNFDELEISNQLKANKQQKNDLL